MFSGRAEQTNIPVRISLPFCEPRGCDTLLPPQQEPISPVHEHQHTFGLCSPRPWTSIWDGNCVFEGFRGTYAICGQRSSSPALIATQPYPTLTNDSTTLITLQRDHPPLSLKERRTDKGKYAGTTAIRHIDFGIQALIDAHNDAASSDAHIPWSIAQNKLHAVGHDREHLPRIITTKAHFRFGQR